MGTFRSAASQTGKSGNSLGVRESLDCKVLSSFEGQPSVVDFEFSVVGFSCIPIPIPIPLFPLSLRHTPEPYRTALHPLSPRQSTTPHPLIAEKTPQYLLYRSDKFAHERHRDLLDKCHVPSLVHFTLPIRERKRDGERKIYAHISTEGPCKTRTKKRAKRWFILRNFTSLHNQSPLSQFSLPQLSNDSLHPPLFLVLCQTHKDH